MTKEEFTDKLQKCYFGEKSAFNEITQYFETLQSKLNEKNKVIKEAIDYINHASAWDWDSVAYEKLMQILERTDK